jgi:hypothetical protein
MPSADLSAIDRARRKAYGRLIPLLFLSYVVAYIDRTNVGIPKLTTASDIGLDNEVFGTAAGIFFIGYFLLGLEGWSSSCWRTAPRRRAGWRPTSATPWRASSPASGTRSGPASPACVCSTRFAIREC